MGMICGAGRSRREKGESAFGAVVSAFGRPEAPGRGSPRRSIDRDVIAAAAPGRGKNFPTGRAAAKAGAKHGWRAVLRGRPAAGILPQHPYPIAVRMAWVAFIAGELSLLAHSSEGKAHSHFLQLAHPSAVLLNDAGAHSPGFVRCHSRPDRD